MTAGGPAGAARPLVIAVGNRFRSDDGVGAAVLARLAEDPDVRFVADLVELDGEPTRLLDAWEDRPLAVVLDAVMSSEAPEGTVVTLAGDEALDPDTVARWNAGVSGHSAGLGEAVGLGVVLERMPACLHVVGVVASSMREGRELSPAVAAAVPAAAAAAADALAKHELTSGGVPHVSG